MSQNNSKIRKTQRRAGALARFTIDQTRLEDKTYLARKEQERLAIRSSVA
jgi:hypothetical protein